MKIEIMWLKATLISIFIFSLNSINIISWSQSINLTFEKYDFYYNSFLKVDT